MPKILTNPFVILAITLLAITFFLSLQKSAKQATYSKQSIEQLEAEVQELEKIRDEDKKKLELADKPIAKEKIIRNELLMQKPGEYVVQIAVETETTAKELSPTPRPPIQAWMELLRE
ncbi:MAG: FtsB family cell division protein [Patescibacteria group bacterium]